MTTVTVFARSPIRNSDIRINMSILLYEIIKITNDLNTWLGTNMFLLRLINNQQDNVPMKKSQQEHTMKHIRNVLKKGYSVLV